MSNLPERVRELWSTNANDRDVLMRMLQGEGYKLEEILREIQVLLEKRVRELWSTNANEQRALMRTLQSEGYKPGEILREIQVLRSGGKRVIKQNKSVDKRYLGCQRDDEGRVVDPFTLKAIAPENLVSYESEGGSRFCFDRRSLYRQYVLGGYQSLQNPFTRVHLPSSLQQDVIGYGESLRTTMTVNDYKLVMEPFTMIGEVVVQYFTSLGSDYLQRLATTNLLYEGASLYEQRLTADAETLDGPITTRPFVNLVEKSEVLILFFEFVKQLRSRPLYETIYFHLGSVLEMVPIAAKEDGFDLQLTADMTVVEVIKEFYRALGEKFSENVYWKYDIVTEYGESLVHLDFHDSISSQIPGEVIHYVEYEDEQQAGNTVFNYQLEAFYENDRHWLDAINAGLGFSRMPDATEYNVNYTAIEFREFLLDLLERDQLQTSNYSVEQLLVDITYKRVRDTIVYPVLLRVIEMNSTERFEQVLQLLARTHKFDEKRALRRYSLSSMEPEIRYVVARRLLRSNGARLTKAFYSKSEGISFYTDDYQSVIELDDVDMFMFVYEPLVVGKNKLNLNLLMQYATRYTYSKIFQTVLTQVDPRYSWKALFARVNGQEYKTLLDRVPLKALERELQNLAWLGDLREDVYFHQCFRVLANRIDETLYHEVNWSSCNEIFDDEKVIAALVNPFLVILVLVGDDNTENIPFFIPHLTEEQAKQLLREYPFVEGLERALEVGYAIELPRVGTIARTQIVADLIYCDGCDLLLNQLIRLGEDSDVAIEIIMRESRRLQRKIASYLIASASYDDAALLLDKYFSEQLDFGILPLEYFRRYLDENKVAFVLTDEQKAKLRM